MWIEPGGTWELLWCVCFHCRCLKIKAQNCPDAVHSGCFFAFFLSPPGQVAGITLIHARASWLTDWLRALPERSHGSWYSLVSLPISLLITGPGSWDTPLDPACFHASASQSDSQSLSGSQWCSVKQPPNDLQLSLSSIYTALSLSSCFPLFLLFLNVFFLPSFSFLFNALLSAHLHKHRITIVYEWCCINKLALPPSFLCSVLFFTALSPSTLVSPQWDAVHLNLLPFGFGFLRLPPCHTYCMFPSMKEVWLLAI